LTTEEAAAIAEACSAIPEIEPIAEAAAHAGTLAIPLVVDLRARVARRSETAAAKVHLGATSQDVADTALMLQAKVGWGLLTRDASHLAARLADLARTHATTPMLGRTLLQPARPITFGLKAANWLLALEAATGRVEREAADALVLQFGGAVGVLDAEEGGGGAVAARLADRLGLGLAPAPWHARRDGIAGLASALAILAGTLGKMAGDIALMAQAEVAEVFEPALAGRGGSSAMAHKRNPTGCQVARSAALRAPHLAATILSVLPQEHERGLGGWQVEAPVLADLFGVTHGALVAMRDVADGLDVRPAQMAKNLAAASVGDDTAAASALVRKILAARASEP
jgi:3-carboxy-cis,cis-muconate cycloisomerase